MTDEAIGAPGERRFVLDSTVRRFPGIVLGGSPISLFRITTAADALVDRIERREPVAPSRLVTALLDGGAIHPVADTPATRFTRADVTVVVPTLGPPSAVPAGDRVVVVDDGSQPPVDGATIRLDTNRGPAAARNAGLACVKTELVAFVDADVTVPDHWIERLLPHLDDERVAVVAPRVRSAGGASALARYEARGGALDLGVQPGRVRAGNRIGYLPAAALLCRVDALRAVEGFDESLRFGEDVDLVWRLDTTGWRCRYEPGVEVEHEPRGSWGDWARQRMSYGSSAAPLALRHRGALAPLRTNGWSLAAWTAPTLGRTLAGTVGAAALGGAIAAGSSLALVPKLSGVPAATSVRFALRGHRSAGANLGESIRRVYWPILLVAGLVCRPARRALLFAALSAGSPLRFADDVAYSVGVWQGMVAHRTIEPARPLISAWPPRRRGRARRRWFAPTSRLAAVR